MLESISRDPWFWAFLATMGWGLGIGFVGTKKIGRSLAFGLVMFMLAEVPRLILPLAFVSQPRIPSTHLFFLIGVIILAGSLFFGTPVFRINPLTGPNQEEPLRTDGLYSIIRHPLMLCDIFWPLGWSLLLGSSIGILLTPVWLLMIWILTFAEEESLVREYGDAYRQFQSHVPRLFPRFLSFGGKRHAIR